MQKDVLNTPICAKTTPADQIQWVSSKEIQKILRISSCALMHRRESGQLIFKKNGNAFLYALKK
jgi:hypothetical protein